MSADAETTGDGSFGRPFRTITAALAAASELESARIRVGPGLYDAALGEQFPLQVPGGVSLEGVGADRTVIAGTGIHNQSLYGGIHDFAINATVVIGHASRTSRLAGFTLSPGPETGPLYYGVFCPRGNAAPAGSPPVPPNTLLDGLHIGPYFEQGVVVVNSVRPNPTGCNLRLTSTHIEGARVGVAALGCDHPGGTGEVPVALELGDGPGRGNVFSNLRAGDHNAVGARLHGCVTRFVAHHNTFISSDSGIWITQPMHESSGLNQIAIVGNRFERLTNMGVLLEGAGMHVTEFRRNSFYLISSRSAQALYPAGAMIVQGLYPKDSPLAEMPRVAKIRENSFVGNDNGVIYRWAALREDFEVPDFGTPDDPGLNDFRCNSSSASRGADVMLHVSPQPMVPLSFQFSGNYWDRVPPELRFGTEPPDGTDIAILRPDAIDVSGAMQSPSLCPEGARP